MNIHSVDLNLLAVFDAVYRSRSVSLAAENLGLSQPAVSNALRRLRAQLNDQLFVRTGQGMLPTPFAQELGETVREAMARLDAGLRQRRGFAPDTERRTFTITMSDIGEVVFLPPLLDLCRREAPGIAIRAVQLDAQATQEALASGEVDLAVGFIPNLSTGVRQQLLFETDYVCMTRADHPSIGAKISRRQFAEAGQALAEAAGTGHYLVERGLERAGLLDRVVLRVPHFLALPLIVAETDLVATVTRPLGEVFRRRAAIRLIEHPLDFPGLPIRQFWHERYHDDPASQWLRGAFLRLFAAGASGRGVAAAR